MQVTQINFGSGKRPVARIDQFKTHFLRKNRNSFVRHLTALNVRLFYNYFELSIGEPSKTKDCETCFREVCIMKTYTVQCQNRLDIIIKSYRFDKIATMLKNMRLTSFSNLLS